MKNYDVAIVRECYDQARMTIAANSKSEAEEIAENMMLDGLAEFCEPQYYSKATEFYVDETSEAIVNEEYIATLREIAETECEEREMAQYCLANNIEPLDYDWWCSAQRAAGRKVSYPEYAFMIVHIEDGILPESFMELNDSDRMTIRFYQGCYEKSRFVHYYLEPLCLNLGTGIKSVTYELKRYEENVVISYGESEKRCCVSGDSNAAIIEDVWKKIY